MKSVYDTVVAPTVVDCSEEPQHALMKEELDPLPPDEQMAAYSGLLMARLLEFDEMDADKNGTLSRDEIASLSKWVLSSFLASEQTLQLSAAQQEAEGPGVVDVAADVDVNRLDNTAGHVDAANAAVLRRHKKISTGLERHRHPGAVFRSGLQHLCRPEALGNLQSFS